jgi:hypothetical protein
MNSEDLGVAVELLVYCLQALSNFAVDIVKLPFAIIESGLLDSLNQCLFSVPLSLSFEIINLVQNIVTNSTLPCYSSISSIINSIAQMLAHFRIPESLKNSKGVESLLAIIVILISVSETHCVIVKDLMINYGLIHTLVHIIQESTFEEEHFKLTLASLRLIGE